VIVIWDNGKPHKGDVIRELCRKYKRLHLETFPPYAPSLNPDEGVWAQAKGSLANGRPDNLLELWWHLLKVLDVLTVSHHLLKACINHSELPLFLP
jgi:transposase